MPPDLAIASPKSVRLRRELSRTIGKSKPSCRRIWQSGGSGKVLKRGKSSVRIGKTERSCRRILAVASQGSVGLAKPNDHAAGFGNPAASGEKSSVRQIWQEKGWPANRCQDIRQFRKKNLGSTDPIPADLSKMAGHPASRGQNQSV